jgi:hypothetical protein
MNNVMQEIDAAAQELEQKQARAVELKLVGNPQLAQKFTEDVLARLQYLCADDEPLYELLATAVVQGERVEIVGGWRLVIAVPGLGHHYIEKNMNTLLLDNERVSNVADVRRVLTAWRFAFMDEAAQVLHEIEQEAHQLTRQVGCIKDDAWLFDPIAKLLNQITDWLMLCDPLVDAPLVARFDEVEDQLMRLLAKPATAVFEQQFPSQARQVETITFWQERGYTLDVNGFCYMVKRGWPVLNMYAARQQMAMALANDTPPF